MNAVHRLILPVLFLLAALVGPAAAQQGSTGRLSSDPRDRLSTVPHSPEMQRAIAESELDMVVVLHEGWRETLPTYARLKIHEITGRTRIPGQDPVYTVLSMTYERDRWVDARIIPVEHPRLLETLKLDGKWTSVRQITENPNLDNVLREIAAANQLKADLDKTTNILNAVEQVHRLGREPHVLKMFEPQGIKETDLKALIDDRSAVRALHITRRDQLRRWNEVRPYIRAAEQLLVRARALNRLGDQFLIMPDSESVDNSWVRPVAMVRAGRLSEAAQRFDLELGRAIALGKPQSIDSITNDFLAVASQSRYYPSEHFRRIQNIYVERNPWRIAAWIYLAACALFGTFFFFRARWMYWSGYALMLVGFAAHSSAVGARLYLTGHAPVSNMFEAITFCSWALMLIAAIGEAWNRRGIVALGSLILAFLFLTGAGLMPLHDTRIHPIRAVLNSYWLNIHVTLMLLSYAALALSFFFATLYLIKSLLGREALFGGTPVIGLQQTEEFAYRLVQLGWPILTFGIALGAVWADVAWGRYWGWDPKETWAFITWVTYTVYLHMRMVMGWRGRWSAFACVIGFVMVMITWLGVSYLPWFAGGLHTYASPR
jgi:cytochrome c-type biogenesis protein CcsB